MSTAQVAAGSGQVYALLADGTTIEIRPASPDDFGAVKAMHEALSPDNTYLRFFNLSRLAADTEARRICRDPAPDQVALLALSGGAVVGCASYVTIGERAAGRRSDVAEIAFAVADHMHHRGIATLLLEHLVSYARSHQITTFTAQTLTENRAMLNVFADAGLPVERHFEDGVFETTFPLPAAAATSSVESYLNAVAEREGSAEAASLRHVLAPESVAVIGAGRRKGTAGRAILDNIRAGGYAGPVYAVNSRASQVGGERCLASVLDLPEAVDLAVIAVPAAAVLDTAERCGQRGVRSLVVVTSGLNIAACADLLAVCRRHGMRLAGPDCFGVAVPGIGLNATFAASAPRSGVAGLVMQSGGLGFAMVDQLSRLGVGISSFASVGDKLDVSGNDLLLWWERDGVTKVAVLYIESFGNPRKFARTARRVGATMPVLTVLAGQGYGMQAPAGQQAPGRPDAPAVSREALFEQAGVIITRGYGELIEATALLATQPVPAGRTVAIVSNVGSAGLLAADACRDLGLTVHRPHGLTRRRLRALVPGRGTVTGPVDTGPIDTGPIDTGATVSGEDFRQCLELLAADDEVNAIIAVVLPTGATGDLVAAITEADVGIPLAAVVLNQPESVRLLPRARVKGDAGRVPAYGYPEAAVAALARAVSYGAWRAEPRGHVPDFADIRAADAGPLAHEFLRQAPAGGWLSPGQAADLLGCYGIALAAGEDTPGHGAARAGGTEVTVRVVADHVFGPLVTFGPGGTDPGTAGHAARLTPLTDTDANQLIRAVFPGGTTPPDPPASGGTHPPGPPLGPSLGPPGALRDLLLRVSRLVGDRPEITGLDLDPVIAGPDGVVVLAARIKAAPYEPQDPFLRKLR
ncbi:MAG: GNAT family N-acetyltransferase [Actinomycetota bacterium]|nr:GNAT family N-acetyltransferase [Actinomycetota bacterium]